MASNDNDKFQWNPILSTNFRTVEFRLKSNDEEERLVRELRDSREAIKDLAKEIGVSLDFDEFEEYEKETTDPNKRLVEQFEYLQAFKDGDTWSVQSVRTIVLQNGQEKQKAYVGPNHSNLTAMEALSKLAAFEAFAIDEVSPFELPNEENGNNIENARKELGEQHFIHAGEQEGLLFDDNLNAHTRISKFVLPLGASFNKEAIERANKLWDEAVQRITKMEVSAEGLVEEMAAGIPANASIDKVLRSIKATTLMDSFAERIEEAAERLETYIENYKGTGKGHIIEEAVDALTDGKTGAIAVLKQMKNENIVKASDLQEWEDFVKEAHIACYVVHAQAMMNLLDENIIRDKEERVAIEKSLHIIGGEEDIDGKVVKVGEMEKTAKKYNLKPSIIAAAKRAMAKSTGPEMPSLLSNYLKRYKERRQAYQELKKKGRIASPKEVLPPTKKLSIRTPGKR